jgi:molybdopterin synthase catalytic subunit
MQASDGMKRHLVITEQPIDEAGLVSSRTASNGMGAAVYFSGIVRETEGDSTILALEYEAFAPMAERQFHLIFDQVESQWPVESIRLVHRLGMVAVGETSLWVEVIAPHRRKAFAACLYVIEEMKRLVPIWKKAVH